MSSNLSLFEGYGIELEYMIVEEESLSVRPISDQLIKAACGEYRSEIERGPIAWSNELALHVIEFKTNGPAEKLEGLADYFQESLDEMLGLLAPMGATLMPTGMHPWMDPNTELRLWPHEYNAVYEAFNRIFDCSGHGWANLQSTHINLPFLGNDEFGRLHAAIRLVLPIIPALAASTPVVERRLTGTRDNRLSFYRDNARAIPSVVGLVIPEQSFTREHYENEILGGIYRDIAPHDRQGTLQHEWVNARGCIARFDRSAIEIRLVDSQECVQAELAVAAGIVGAVRSLIQQEHCLYEEQKTWHEEQLLPILLSTLEHGDETSIRDSSYLRALGVSDKQASAGDVWRALIDRMPQSEWSHALNTILEDGCLARRIETALGPNPGSDRLHAVYRRLSQCLQQGRSFNPREA